MALVIMTDSNSDFPYQKLDRLDVEILPMPYFIDGEQTFHDMGRGERTSEFFAAMRAGKDLKTSMLNPLQYEEAFTPFLQRGDDILFLCMSSALSSTYDNALLARTEMLAKHPGRRLEIIDSRTMSIGMARAAEEALAMRDKGMDIDGIAQALQQETLPCQHILLTVDDLGYLRKSGRLTGASAFLGTMLDIKPIIQLDTLGRLVPQEKVKGRRNSLKKIAKRVEESIENPQGQWLRIAQADCLADAEKLREYLLELMPELGGVEITYLGPVISVHVGAGALGVMWQGKNRNDT